MKKFVTMALATSAALVLGASAQAQNLLNNGSLDATYQEVIVDNAPPGPGMEDFFLPKPLGWVNEGFRTLTGPYEDEMSSEPWAGPAPTPVTTGGSDGGDWAAFFKAFSGDLANGPATGHLYQDVPAVVGTPYRLSGWAGAESNFLAAGAEIALEFIDGGGNVMLGAGQVVNLLPTLYVDNMEAFDYKQYTASGVAPAGAVSVRARASMLGGTPNPLGGGQAFVVDDFELVAVPEPATGALAAAGLAALMLRRRK